MNNQDEDLICPGLLHNLNIGLPQAIYEDSQMKRGSTCRREGDKRRSSGRQSADLEFQFASLFSELLSSYDGAMRLKNELECRHCIRASSETLEIAVFLKSALRICGDAMSHLPD